MDYDAIQKILDENNRKFNNSDARSSYADLRINTNLSELLIFSLIELFDSLQFSACEMWLSSSSIKYSSITLEDVLVIKELIKVDLNNKGYHSNELIKVLISIYDSIRYKKDRNLNVTFLDDHLYDSISKELFCYRAGHELVQKYRIILVGE